MGLKVKVETGLGVIGVWERISISKIVKSFPGVTLRPAK